jgi:hypothetical protein
MLNLSEQIRECLQHAEHCARKAKSASSAELRDDYLMIEKKWLSLAQSYGFMLKTATSSAPASDRIEPTSAPSFFESDRGDHPGGRSSSF